MGFIQNMQNMLDSESWQKRERITQAFFPYIIVTVKAFPVQNAHKNFYSSSYLHIKLVFFALVDYSL